MDVGNRAAARGPRETLLVYTPSLSVCSTVENTCTAYVKAVIRASIERCKIVDSGPTATTNAVRCGKTHMSEVIALGGAQKWRIGQVAERRGSIRLKASVAETWPISSRTGHQGEAHNPAPHRGAWWLTIAAGGKWPGRAVTARCSGELWGGAAGRASPGLPQTKRCGTTVPFLHYCSGCGSA